MASILIIEDVATVLMSLRIVLHGAGHQVTCAQDGEQGLKLLEQAAFDLVITDIWMPRSNGADVIREGKARWPRTRFLAITGGDPNSGGSSDTLRRQDFGADQVLLKPFEKMALLNAVSRLLEPVA
jgi:CheY-like chemotaxis protein